MVVGVVLIVFGATMGFTLTQTPIYQSDIKLLVGPEKSGTPREPRERGPRVASTNANHDVGGRYRSGCQGRRSGTEYVDDTLKTTQ